MIDYYQQLLLAQQQADPGARWFFEPQAEHYWTPAQPYVPDPTPEVSLYQPQPVPERRNLYTPTELPTPAYTDRVAKEAQTAITPAPQARVEAPKMASFGYQSGGGGGSAYPNYSFINSV